MSIYDLMENKIKFKKGTSKQFIKQILDEKITEDFYVLEDTKELILPNIREEKLLIVPVEYIPMKEYIKNFLEVNK